MSISSFNSNEAPFGFKCERPDVRARWRSYKLHQEKRFCHFYPNHGRDYKPFPAEAVVIIHNRRNDVRYWLSQRGMEYFSSIHTLYLLFFGSTYLPYCQLERQPKSVPSTMCTSRSLSPGWSPSLSDVIKFPYSSNVNSYVLCKPEAKLQSRFHLGWSAQWSLHSIEMFVARFITILAPISPMPQYIFPSGLFHHATMPWYQNQCVLDSPCWWILSFPECHHHLSLAAPQVGCNGHEHIFRCTQQTFSNIGYLRENHFTIRVEISARPSPSTSSKTPHFIFFSTVRSCQSWTPSLFKSASHSFSLLRVESNVLRRNARLSSTDWNEMEGIIQMSTPSNIKLRIFCRLVPVR